MFEGRILHSGFQTGLNADAAAADSDIGGSAAAAGFASWAELTARFGAARDLRKAMNNRPHDECGSFDASFARHIARLGKGKHGINPVALVDGKASRGIISVVAGNAATGDRGTQ